MNDNALKAAEVLENNVAEIKSAINLDNDKMVLQTIKRMVATTRRLKKSIKENAKLKKALAKNIDQSALNNENNPSTMDDAQPAHDNSSVEHN